MIGGRVLDVSALVDYGTGRVYVRALVGAAVRSGGLVLAVPAAALRWMNSWAWRPWWWSR